MGRKITCQQCYQSSHEVTDKYDPSVPVDGTMVRLSEPYRSWGWEMFNEDDPGVKEGDMMCGFCGNRLFIDNVAIIEDKPATLVEVIDKEEPKDDAQITIKKKKEKVVDRGYNKWKNRSTVE